MNLYDKNIELIKNNAVELYSTLTIEESRNELKNVQFVNSSNLLVEKDDVKCYLHSVYSVGREIEEMFRYADKNVRVLIVFGMGLCYCVEHIRKNFLNLERLIVIEPNLDLFKNVLSIVDLAEVYKGIQVSFAINKTSDGAYAFITSSIKDGFDIDVAVVYNVSYRTIFKDYYEKVHANIITYIRNSLVNLGTKEFFKYQWNINIVRNLKHTQYLLNEFQFKYRGKSAVIVSAGPSLNKNIELLKGIYGKAMIVPVGTSINILHNKGIKPDLRFAFDGSNAENAVFKDIDTSICPLVYTDKLYFEILDNYKGPKIKMIGDLDIFSKYIHDNAGLTQFPVRGGFSIANLAAYALITMGFQKIVFIGQDLCYTEGKLFADGVANNDETVNLNNSSIFKTNDIFGNEVYTDKQFWGMKQYFETLIHENPDVKFINATEGGLNIIGAENSTLEKVIKEELNEEHDFSFIFQEIIKDIALLENNEKIRNMISVIKDELSKIQIINDNRISKMKKFKKLIDKNVDPKRLNNEIEYIKSMERDMNDIEFYRVVIGDNLRNSYRALEVTFKYNGNDLIKQIEADNKILMAKIMELDLFIHIMKDLITEVEQDFIENKKVLIQ